MKFIHLFILVFLLANTSLFAQKIARAEMIPSRTYTKKPPANVADLPWDGSYFGVINCANCEGIEMELTLKKNNKYLLSTKEINGKDAAYIQKGKFVWDGNIVFLKNALLEMPYMFQIEEFQAKAIFYIFGELKGANWTGYTLNMPHIIRVE